jgi:hypothetical protein
MEVHDEAVPLYGYQGDVRAQTAHIVIRRQHVGTAANGDGTCRRLLRRGVVGERPDCWREIAIPLGRSSYKKTQIPA